MSTASARHWDEVAFDEIIEDSAFGPRFSGDAYAEDGNVATLRTTDISEDGRISYGTMPLAQLDEASFANHLLKIDDLVITRSGRVGTTALFGGYHLPVLPGAFLIRFRLRDGADPRFFRYWFNSRAGQQRLLSVARGAAQQNINITNVKTLKVPLPPILVQGRIASILSAYDDLIENNRRRIQLLEQAARLLYKEWFVHLRFPGHEHVKIKDGVPEGWEKKTLSEIASTNVESYRAQELPDEINYIDISSVAQGRVTAKNALTSAEAPGRARRKAKSGDVIWSNVRPNLRAYALILASEENDVFSTGFTVLSPLAVPFSYLYLLVTTDEFVGHLVNHATGASYPAVRPDDFERAIVFVPPKQVLEHFHEKTEPSYRLISILEKENKALAKGRDLLLPRLMNGEAVV